MAIQKSKKDISHFKCNGNMYVDIKYFLHFCLFFFLAFFSLIVDESINSNWIWQDNLLAFSILIAFASFMVYGFFRDGLFCFAADQDGWYFRNKGQMTLMRVPWSDCRQFSKQSQSGGEGTAIVFNINRSAVTTALKPKNAHVSEKGDTISIEFNGLIFSQSKKIRKLEGLQRGAITRK